MAALLGVLAVSLLVPAGPVRAEGSGDEPHPPQAVTGRVSITNSVSHSSVELTWSEPASGSAAQYRIVRQSVHFYGMVFQVGEPVTVTGRSYTDTDVIPSRLYRYSVTPTNSSGDGPTTWSETIQVPVHVQSLPGPDNLRVLSSDRTQVAIGWGAVADATGYEVTRIQWHGGTLGINSKTTYIERSVSQTSLVDTGVERGASYIYWIRTRNSHGVGSLREVHAQAGRPIEASELAPSNLTAKLVDDGISLEWDAPVEDAESVTGYKIARGPVFVFGEFDDEGALRWLADTGNANTAFVDGIDIRPGYRYTYMVMALRDSERSAGSDTAELEIPPDAEIRPYTIPCTGPAHVAGEDSTPDEMEVTDVPIVVESSTDEYFVLYVLHDVDGTQVEVPVSVTLGEAGTTTLTENVPMLPKERYRVEKHVVAKPSDIDGDCIDDITELNGLGMMNPINTANTANGRVALPDWETFEKLSYQLSEGGRRYLAFAIFDIDTDRPHLYFISGESHLAFLQAIGRAAKWDETFTAIMTYDPILAAPDGRPGMYYYEFNRREWFLSADAIRIIHTVLVANMPLLEDNLGLFFKGAFEDDLLVLRDSRVPIVFEEDLLAERVFLPLNSGEGYGRLRVMEPDERPHPHDIVIYEALPNEMPRVAGIMSTVPQTPLSHVNLRAIQDGVPNAFIRNAVDLDAIEGLIGSYVHYTVTETSWNLRPATPAEVDAHYASSRPVQEQVPERDLTVTSITPLSDIGFADWKAFGVKAANVAVLGTLGFPDGTVPDGFAVPFYFYDEFMKHNGLYDYIDEMLADTDFQTDFDTQESELTKLRKKIKKAETPDWMDTALEEMHAAFPEGASLRYRSSTNNEDLPGFNGAGLYDSKTQHPEETEEDGIAKSLKQVYASLWNFRAFTEREFHRIDHRATAMGVLVHPNYSDEIANGVAVSFDPITGIDGNYYVNTQVGEDLVTNPDAHSVPEEVLLTSPPRQHLVLGFSNQVPAGQHLMSNDRRDLLRRYLEVIHEKFEELYCVEAGERFAMEIEFKITSEDILAIKQARPWVFIGAQATGCTEEESNRPATGAAQVGETLTADVSGIEDADGLDNAAFAYQRLADGEPVEGSIEASYTLVEEDSGKTITVSVSFTDDAGNEESLESDPTEAVSATAPGAPRRVSVSPLDTGSLDVRWEAPGSDGGSPVTGYRVQWRRASASWDETAEVSEAMATATSHIITGLEYGEEYAVRIIAVNEAGEGALSAQQTGRPAEPAEPPPAPQNLTVTLGPGSVTLTWDPPDDSTVTGYQILRRRPPLGENQLLAHVENTGSTDASYTDTDDLALGYRHVYRVQAINSAGLGGVSNYVRAVPTTSGEEEPPPPPLGLAAAAAGQEEAALRWDALSGASQYLIEYRNGDGGEWRVAGSSVGIAKWTVTGLTCGFEYEFRVRSYSGGGTTYTVGVWGPPSAAGSATTDGCDPDTEQQEAEPAPSENSPATGAPTISGTVQVGETLTADTSGIADADGLADVSFTYQWLADGADIQGATGSGYTLQDADEGKTITVKVSFADDAGNGETLTSAATVAIEATVAEEEPTAPPPAPTNLTATVNADGSVTLTWDASDDDSVTGYLILRRRPYEGERTLLVYVEDTGSTATTFTDTDVTAGTQHVYRVKAINEAGVGNQSNYVNVDP